jgi:hypothetical protein
MDGNLGAGHDNHVTFQAGSSRHKRVIDALSITGSYRLATEILHDRG